MKIKLVEAISKTVDFAKVQVKRSEITSLEARQRTDKAPVDEKVQQRGTCTFHKDISL